MTQEHSLLIGEVVGTHGVRGVLKIRSYAESPDIFPPDTPLSLVTPRGERRDFTVQWVKAHKKAILMALEGVVDCGQAETLVGSALYIGKDKLPELESDTYYWFDLIGLSVFDAENAYLGKVESIFETGSNDVLVVKDRDRGPKHEVLIPALATVIESVDLKEKKLRVKLPEGL